MKKTSLLLLLSLLFSLSCEDEDEVKDFTVDIHELKGITLQVGDRSIDINLNESYEQVASKLPNGYSTYSLTIDFYQVNFDFTTTNLITGDLYAGPLNTITVFNPDVSWFYTDKYKLKAFYTDAGLTSESANKAGTQTIYGPGDKINSSEKDAYDSLNLTVRYQDSGDYYYIKIGD